MKYGVVRQTTAGYTPQHNAFVERWFRTNAEMSRCQMLQFNSDEALWEDSRRMATFIYNRVPPAHKTPGEPWLSPMAKQYPDRITMDMTRLQPFGLPCYVYQKKPKRDGGYSGKSDKKANAKKGMLVGYDDQQGPLRVKVYYPTESTWEWVAEELVTFEDPLNAISNTQQEPAEIVQPEQPMEYFLPLVGTRHTDPENGLQYQTTTVKVDRQGFIVAYRRRFHKGKMIGRPDGPIHVMDIYSYTKQDIQNMNKLTGHSDNTKTASIVDTDCGRMVSGSPQEGSEASEKYSSSDVSGIDNPNTSSRTARPDTAASLKRKWSSDYPASNTAPLQPIERSRRTVKPIDRLSSGFIPDSQSPRSSCHIDRSSCVIW